MRIKLDEVDYEVLYASANLGGDGGDGWPPSMVNRQWIYGKKLLEVDQSWDHSPIVPVLAVLMLALTVFLLVLFRQNPTLVACTVAACLVIIGMYLTLNNIQENKLKFE